MNQLTRLLNSGVVVFGPSLNPRKYRVNIRTLPRKRAKDLSMLSQCLKDMLFSLPGSKGETSWRNQNHVGVSK